MTQYSTSTVDDPYNDLYLLSTGGLVKVVENSRLRVQALCSCTRRINLICDTMGSLTLKRC